MTSVIWFTLLLVTSCQLIQSQENAHTRIPDYLLPCYRNHTLRHPENRPPMTMKTLIQLIRKVEDYERSNIEMVELATTMLHRFRLDGITRTPGVQETDGVVPWGVNGLQFFKHRLVLKHMIPKNNYAFPNNSLSDIELCTLHFMLSSSIDNTERGDESTTCSRLSNYQMSHGRKPRHLRFIRNINNTANAELESKSTSSQLVSIASPTSTSISNKSFGQKAVESSKYDTSEEKSPKLEMQANEKQSTGIPHVQTESKNVTQELQITTEKDSGNVDIFNNTAIDTEGDKGKFIFDDDIISPRIAPVRMEPSTIPPRRDAIDQRKLGQAANYPESLCPVENGVIWTEWGAISAGPLLAGIASGVYSQNIKVSNLVVGGARASKMPLELRESEIDNRYAATLVGDLAEVTLVDGPKGTFSIGTDGGWNSTVFPKWYFIRTTESIEMTDAEIRGALDGLIMAKNIQQWKNLIPAGALKLSQVLENYYSKVGVFDPKFRACYRKEMYTEVAKSSELKDQSYRLSAVLDEYMISGASIDDEKMKAFANTAVDKLTSYIPSLGFSCPSKALRDADDFNTKLYMNLTVVIDCSWDYRFIRSVLLKLMEEIDIRLYGSKMTVVDGKNFKPLLFEAQSSLDIANFTDAEYSLHERGIDIPFALEQGIRDSMKGVLDLEKEKGTSNGLSQVVLFIPQTPIRLSDEDMTIAKDGIDYFKDYLPDVHFFYTSPGNKENYQYLVLNYNTDVFNIEYNEAESSIPVYAEQIVKRLKKVHQRITNPVCGSEWSGDYRTAETTHFVQPDGIQYHRFHPNYFYDSNSIIVKVQGYGYGSLQVCHSRQVEYPANRTNDVECKTISSNEAIEIQMSSPCSGYKYISQCPPLYMSVAATGTTMRCTDPSCYFPNYIKYTITHEGARCTAGAGHLLGSAKLSIISLALLMILKYSLNFNY